MSALAVEEARLATYRGLMGTRQRFGEHWLASMLASQWHGMGAMPALLGLGPDMFERMLAVYFPGHGWSGVLAGDGSQDTAGMPEYHELKRLFAEHQAAHLRDQPWWIELLIAGCGGRNHLWEDLGLFNRRDLSLMMHTLFPGLAEKNIRDMKWKKFLYKQLCEQEGIIACPTPSCDDCAHFAECFAPED